VAVAAAAGGALLGGAEAQSGEGPAAGLADQAWRDISTTLAEVALAANSGNAPWPREGALANPYGGGGPAYPRTVPLDWNSQGGNPPFGAYNRPPYEGPPGGDSGPFAPWEPVPGTAPWEGPPDGGPAETAPWEIDDGLPHWEEGPDFQDWEQGEEEWLHSLEVEVAGCRRIVKPVGSAAADRAKAQLVYDVSVRMPRGVYKPGFVILASSNHPDGMFALDQPSAFSPEPSAFALEQHDRQREPAYSLLERTMDRVVERERKIPKKMKKRFQRLAEECMQEHRDDIELYKDNAEVQKVWRTGKGGKFLEKAKHTSRFWTEETCETDKRVFKAFLVAEQRGRVTKPAARRARRVGRLANRPNRPPTDLESGILADMDAVLRENKRRPVPWPRVTCQASNGAALGNTQQAEMSEYYGDLSTAPLKAEVKQCSKVRRDDASSTLTYEIQAKLPRPPKFKVPKEMRGFALLLSARAPGGLEPSWGQDAATPILTADDRIIAAADSGYPAPGEAFSEAMKLIGVDALDIFARPNAAVTKDAVWGMLKGCAAELQPRIQLDPSSLRVESLRPLTLGGADRGEFTAVVDTAWPDHTCGVDGRHFQLLLITPDYPGVGPICQASDMFLYQDSFSKVLKELQNDFSTEAVQILTVLQTLWQLNVEPERTREFLTAAGVRKDSEVGRLFADMARLSKVVRHRMDNLPEDVLPAGPLQADSGAAPTDLYPSEPQLLYVDSSGDP